MKNLGKLYFPNGCNHCGGKVEFIDSILIYGISFGMCYRCIECNAYVGAHKPKNMHNQPLGRLANEKERKLKKKAHQLFDPLWKTGKINSIMPEPINMKERKKAYLWLSKKLNIPFENCHMGHFSEETLLKAIAVLEKT